MMNFVENYIRLQSVSQTQRYQMRVQTLFQSNYDFRFLKYLSERLFQPILFINKYYLLVIIALI